MTLFGFGQIAHYQDKIDKLYKKNARLKEDLKNETNVFEDMLVEQDKYIESLEKKLSEATKSKEK